VYLFILPSNFYVEYCNVICSSKVLLLTHGSACSPVCDRYGEAVSWNSSEKTGARHSPAGLNFAPVHLSFFGLYQQRRGKCPRPSFSLGLGSLGAEQGLQIMVLWRDSLLLCGWLSSSQPGSRVTPCPEVRASVTARSSGLVRSLFPRLTAGCLLHLLFSL
jgi:hypothetical protein